MRARVVLERDPFLVLAIVCFTGSSVFPNLRETHSEIFHCDGAPSPFNQARNLQQRGAEQACLPCQKLCQNAVHFRPLAQMFCKVAPSKVLKTHSSSKGIEF